MSTQVKYFVFNFVLITHHSPLQVNCVLGLGILLSVARNTTRMMKVCC